MNIGLPSTGTIWRGSPESKIGIPANGILELKICLSFSSMRDNHSTFNIYTSSTIINFTELQESRSFDLALSVSSGSGISPFLTRLFNVTEKENP